MKLVFFAAALPLVFLVPGDAGAVTANSSPGYVPPQIQAPPQFNGGNITTPPPAARIAPPLASPVVGPRRRR